MGKNDNLLLERISERSNKILKDTKAKKVKCIYCSKSFVLKDTNIKHIITPANGGCNHPHNKLSVCKKCNGEKDSILIDEWLELNDANLINDKSIARKVIQTVDCLSQRYRQIEEETRLYKKDKLRIAHTKQRYEKAKNAVAEVHQLESKLKKANAVITGLTKEYKKLKKKFGG